MIPPSLSRAADGTAANPPPERGPSASDPSGFPESFFVAGGTLPRDAPSYVERQADADLFRALDSGEFCYVLTARQMGKSSLMVRTATRLKRADATTAVAVLDLTAVGQNLSAAQWYRGLLGRLGRQLDLEEELTQKWRQSEELGSLQRWTETVFDTLLEQCPGRIVLFIDEIDAVRSLPFPADEFFGAIRESYNRRTQDPRFDRLTFCLLGVASPSELIGDARMSPFNIGTRIILTDFTEADAAPLAQALPGGDAALARVLYWTGGHPYLTQRLCQAAVTELSSAGIGAGRQPASIDQLCAQLFLGRGAREKDNNLLFVQDRLLRIGGEGSEATTALLDLQGRILSGRRVTEEEAGSAGQALLLSGISRVDARGVFHVRNRIYAHAFDRRWIQQNLPGAELRRQRRAYRLGMWRALSVSGAVLAVVVWLALTALLANNRAQRSELQARQQLFTADMNLAQRAYTENNVARTLQLLAAHRDNAEESGRFEWRYLWALCHGEAALLPDHAEGVTALRFTPDGALLTADGAVKAIRTWNWRKSQLSQQGIDDGNGIPAAKAMPGAKGIAFSPSGDRFAVWAKKQCRIYDTKSGRLQQTLQSPDKSIKAAYFSRSGNRLAVNVFGGRIHVWNLSGMAPAPGTAPTVPTVFPPLRTLQGASRILEGVALSSDSRFVAATDLDGGVFLWNLATESRANSSNSGKAPRRLRGAQRTQGPRGSVKALGFSPDGRLLATGDPGGAISLWNTATGQLLHVLRGHSGQVTALEFAPDGRRLATVSKDQTARLWEVVTGREIRTIRGHTDAIEAVSFSADGKWLATGSSDGGARIWNVQDEPAAAPGKGISLPLRAVRLVPPDGERVAIVDRDNRLHVWPPMDSRDSGLPKESQNADTRRAPVALAAPRGEVVTLALSPTGSHYMAVDTTGAIREGDVATGRTIRTIRTLQQFMGKYTVIMPVVFSPDGTRLAVGEGDGMRLAVGRGDSRVWLLDAATGKLLRTFVLPSGGTTLTFSPDGRFLAAAGANDSAIQIVEVASGRVSRLFQEPAQRRAQLVTYLTFSPDGTQLASTSEDGTIRLWPLAGNSPTRMLQGHAGVVYAAAFSPDGRTLATGGYDRTVRLWDVATAREVLTLPFTGGRERVTTLRFDRSGEVLYALGGNGRTGKWRSVAPSATSVGAWLPQKEDFRSGKANTAGADPTYTSVLSVSR